MDKQLKNYIEDKFGNTIRIGDYVFVACCATKIARYKVKRITPKGVYLDGGGWANINAVAKDHTQELDYLHSRDLKLSHLESLSVDRWKGYESADGEDFG